MADDLGGQLGRFWRGLRQKTADTVARQEAAFARGKIAGTAVLDDAGEMIVDAGHPIDDAVIERAAVAGKLRALAVSAGMAQVQDAREKARDHLAQTLDGREARALDSVDDYVAARRYVGRTAGVDVTDIRGNVIVPAGKEIKEEDVRLAREAGLLSALVYSAQQAAPVPTPPAVAEPERADEEFRSQTLAVPQRRSSLPLVSPPDSPDRGPT
jgi:hypothetical protein